MEQRPRGLKRSVAAAAAAAEAEAAQKRVREEDKDVAGNTGANEEEEVEELEFALPEGDDLDPFEQCEAILQAALECLEEGEDAHGRALLQGAVHECDGVIASQPDEAVKRPSIFRVFGDSLRHLGLVLKKPEFFEVADRNYVTALKHAPKDVRAAVMRARNEIDTSAVVGLDDARTAAFKERLQHALGIIPSEASSEREDALELVSALGHEILAVADAEEASTEAFVALARHTFQRLQVADPTCAAALAGQGACERSLAVAESPQVNADMGTKILRSAIKMAEGKDQQVAQFSVWLAELLLATGDDQAFEEAVGLLRAAKDIDSDLVSDEMLEGILNPSDE